MLRDRFDIIDKPFTDKEQATSFNAQQPYGGVADISVNYPIAAVRVDNYTNRWILFDSEGFVVPPFTHGFVINLFSQQQRVVFRSVKSPFASASVNYVYDLNPKLVTAPFPTRCLVSLYDEPQSQLAPQSLVRIDNALIEPSAARPTLATGGISSPIPITTASPGAPWPAPGSVGLGVFNVPLYFENQDAGQIAVGARNIEVMVGGQVAVLAGIWTSIPAADQPGNIYSVTFPASRVKLIVLSTDTAGVVSFRDQFHAVQGTNGAASMLMAANTPVMIPIDGPGWWMNEGGVQLRCSVAATLYYTFGYASKT